MPTGVCNFYCKWANGRCGFQAEADGDGCVCIVLGLHAYLVRPLRWLGNAYSFMGFIERERKKKEKIS